METEGSGADDAAAGMDGVVRKSDFANAKVVDGMSSNSAAARQRRTAKLRAEYGEIPLTFYLTLAITNLDEATFEQVKLAAGDSFGYEEEKVSTAYLPRLAGFIASKVLSPETMTEQVSDELARQLPDKLKDFGIEMHMKTVFCHGCIAVVECLACDVALKKLVELAGAQRKCCKDAPVLKCILKCLQCCGFDDDVEALIVRPRAVEKVMVMLESELPPYLQTEHGIQCEVMALHAEDFGPAFFSILERLHLHGCSEHAVEDQPGVELGVEEK